MSNLEQEVNELVKEIPKKLKILDQKLGAIDTQSQLNPSFNDSKLSQRRSGALDDFFISLCEPFAEILGIGDNLLISASGSYGRNEHVPKSDTDIIVIGRTEDKSLNMLSKILMYDIYAGGSKYVFGEGTIYPMGRLSSLEPDEIVPFLDMRPLIANQSFYTQVMQTLRKNYNPLEVSLHLLSELEIWHRDYPQGIDNVKLFDIKLGIGGLRHLQVGVWLEGLKNFESSQTIYERMSANKDGRKVIDALNNLITIRYWLNVNKGRNGDKLTYDDIIEAQKFFGNNFFERLYNARSTIKRYTEGVINGILDPGIPVADNIVNGRYGLKITHRPLMSDFNKTFYGLLTTAQKRGLQIEPETANDLYQSRRHIRPRQEFVDLFGSKGSLSNTLVLLEKLDILDKLLPGFSQIQTAIYDGNHWVNTITKAGRAIERIRYFDSIYQREKQSSVSPELDEQLRFIIEEYRTLEPTQLQALHLALFVKGIPETIGISMEKYINQLHKLYPKLQSSTTGMIRFLTKNKDFLSKTSQAHLIESPNSVSTIDNLVQHFQDSEHLRNLFLFTAADLSYGIYPYLRLEQWQKVEEIYKLIMGRLTGSGVNSVYNPFSMIDDPEGKKIIESLPESFMYSRFPKDNSLLRDIARDLKNAVQQNYPIVRLIGVSENSYLFRTASLDYRGLLWRIAGACYKNNISIDQAEIFTTSTNPPLALNFLNVHTIKYVDLRKFQKEMEGIIQDRSTGDLKDPLELIRDAGGLDFQLDSEVGYYKLTLRGKDRRGLLYASARIIDEQIEGNIIRTAAYTDRFGNIEDYLFFKTDKSFKEVSMLAANSFRIN